MAVNRPGRLAVDFPAQVLAFEVRQAEVVADGSVIVWGRVRGMIHAGAKGDRNAFICALDLSATQLRIADEVSDVLKPQKEQRPEVASINNEGRLQAEIWKTG